MKTFSTITVIGRDKTGVIARVASFLFEHGANIEALEEQVTRGQFSMTLQASWQPTRCDPVAIRTGLGRLATQLKMEITIKFADPARRQRFAIMVSKLPHCLDAVIQAQRKGHLAADPAVVISNRKDLEPTVRKYGLPLVSLDWRVQEEAERKALRILDEHGVDFIVLARFMRILSPNFVWRYKNKIINIHPSLLPSFPGAQAYRQAYEGGVKIAGVTAHFVSMHLDEGPIIAQDCFRVKPRMTLEEVSAAGRQLEAKVLVRAIQLYLTKRLDVYWGVVREV